MLYTQKLELYLIWGEVFFLLKNCVLDSAVDLAEIYLMVVLRGKSAPVLPSLLAGFAEMALEIYNPAFFKLIRIVK